MSDLSQYQKEVCEVPEKAPIKKICPTCIPNPSYMAPDWTKMVGKPFLNEKTCEYMIGVTVNKYGNPFVVSPSNKFPSEVTGEERTRKRKILRSYVEPAIRLMLEEYGKLIADQIICAKHMGPALDGTPADLLTNYGTFEDAYMALAVDPITLNQGEVKTKNACYDIDLPMAPMINPEDAIDFTQTLARCWGSLPEINNPFALEIYAYPKEWTVSENGGGLLKVLVAIPAYILERVPDNPTRDEIEEEATTPVNEVVLTVEKLWGQIQRLKSSMWVYSQYQSAFAQIQDGYLYTPVEEEKIDYYASVYSERTGAFYKTLKDVAKDNGWNIKSNLKSVIRNNARLIKITFDNSDEDKPYVVSKIETKKLGCEYEEWTKGLSKLYLVDPKAKTMNEPDPFDQTVWNYIAKINEIDIGLQAKKSYPWMDFLIRYTYPLLSVDYGRFGEKALEESGMACVSENAKKFGVELRDYMLNESLSISDFISYEFNKKSCTDFGDLTNEHEVVVEESERKKKRESIKDAKETGKKDLEERKQQQIDSWQIDIESHKGKLAQLTPEVERWTRLLYSPEESRWRHADVDIAVKTNEELYEGINDFENQIKESKEKIKEIEDRIKKTDEDIGKKQIRQAGRKAAAAKRKELKNPDPYYKLGYEAALEEFEGQDSLLMSLVPKDDFQTSGGLNLKTLDAVDLSDIMSRMTLCNLKSLTIQSVRCLFSGLTEEDALTKIVKATLEAMDLDVFGFFIRNLPPESQRKLREAFEKEFKDLPLPWEDGYDPGAIENTNAYLKYMTKTPEGAPKDPEEEKTTESAETTSDIADVPTEEIKEVVPTPEHVVHPTPEDLTVADETWVGYLQRRLDAGYSTGEPVKRKWYEFSEKFWIAKQNNRLKKFSGVYDGIINNPIKNVNVFLYDNYVSWYNATYEYFKKEGIQTHLMRVTQTVEEIQKLIDMIDTKLAIEVADEKLKQQEATEIDQLVREMGEVDDAPEEQAKTFEEEVAQIQSDTQFEEEVVLSPGTQWAVDRTKQAREWSKQTYVGRSATATAQGTRDKWNKLTDKEKYKFIQNENYKYDPAGKQGTYGNALGNVQEMVVQAYIDYMIDLLEIDELMQLLDRFPGSDIIPKIVGDISCAYQGMFKPPVKSFLSTLSLDVCGDLGIGIGVPGIENVPEVDGFFDRSSLLVLKKQFAGKVEGVLTEVIKRIILKVLEGIDNALCKSLNAVAQLATDAMQGKSRGVHEAFGEAFCPDADEEELNNTMGNIFKASGITGSGISDQSFDGLYKSMNATTSKKEILGLLTTSAKKMDSKVLGNMSDLVKARHPELAGVFGTPQQISQVFSRAANLIPPEMRKFIQDQVAAEPDGPVYDSVCLTKPELDDWNNKRKIIHENNGFDPDTAEDLVNDFNDKLGNDADDLLNILQNGTDDILGDAINSLMERDPGCVNDKTAMLFEDENLRTEKTGLIKSLFDNIERTFMDEIINGRHGVLNNILRDKNNFRLSKHERRADSPFFFPNYTNSPEDWEFREQNSNILIAGRMRKVLILNPDPKPLGNYPETVGILMRDQLESAIPTFKTSISGSSQTPQISLSYEDSPEEVSYSFVLDYRLNHINKSSKQITVTETYHNKIKKKEAEKLGIDYSLFSRTLPPIQTLDLSVNETYSVSQYSNFDYDNYKSTHPYQSLVFNSLLESKIGGAINSNGDLINTYAAINNKVLNFSTQAVITNPDGGIPNGFNFGYESAAPLTFEDLWYVNPDALPGDKSTWFYSHLPKERVLGKSATENPRVHFLDPALHGGNYLFPKIYVEPATYNGWLGMVRTFIPELEACEESDNGFLNVSEIAKRVKSVEDNTPMDKRLSLAPDCRIEVPYDKHFSPASHGIMEGIVLTTMKVYATEFIIKTLPIFSGVEFSDKNIDSTFLGLLVDQLKSGLNSQTTRWNMVQGHTYYLLFLEQAVQTVHRQIQDGLMEKTPDLEAAFEIITATQRQYKPTKVDITNLKNFDWSGIVDTFRGAAIIAFGEEWEEDFDKILTKEALENIALLMISPTAAISKGLLFAITRLGFLTPFKIRMARKINSIDQSRDAAETILKALMVKEIRELMDKINLNMRPRPHINDIQKYLLSRNGIVLGSTLRSGEMVIERPTVEGATGFDYGDVYDVVRDPTTENPLGNKTLSYGAWKFSMPPGYDDVIDYVSEGISIIGGIPAIVEQLKDKLKEVVNIPLLENGFFYLEKYIRVLRKDGTQQVYNIKEFQEMIGDKITYSVDYHQQRELDPETVMDMDLYLDPNGFISNYYGNAYVVDDELKGSIGVKFGVRLIYAPPISFEYEIPDKQKQERTYKFPPTEVLLQISDGFYEKVEKIPIPLIRDTLTGILDDIKVEAPGASRAIPVAIFEHDIKDRKISEINLEDKNLGEDLKCYVDKLVESEDFQVLFDLCFPLKSYVSLLGVYSYYGFFESIGKTEEGTPEKDEDVAKLREKWKLRVFRKTKKQLRQLFNSTYRTDDDVKEEKEGRSRKEKSDFMKNLLPQAFLNLDSSVQWWQSVRFIEVKPFDPDGNECMNAFQKMFR